MHSAPTLPLRVFAGVFCALTHGCLRVSDLQRSENITLTSDAILAVTWKMKRKKSKVPWAASATGFSDKHWAETWMGHLRAANLPGKDFVVLAPSADHHAFIHRIAKFSDFANAQRVLCTLPPLNMGPDEALSYTPHSWRHLYPTAARQLGLSDTQLEEIGHWAHGSSMPRVYDSAACVSELLAKSKVVGAISKGWNVVEPGCLPEPFPIEHPSPTNEVDPSIVKPTSDIVVRNLVLNCETNKLHFSLTGPFTLCMLWKCGSFEQPAKSARFLYADATTSHELYQSCCRSRLADLFKVSLNSLENCENQQIPHVSDSESSVDELGNVQW